MRFGSLEQSGRLTGEFFLHRIILNIFIVHVQSMIDGIEMHIFLVILVYLHHKKYISFVQE